jgi:hypothetical protein
VSLCHYHIILPTLFTCSLCSPTECISPQVHSWHFPFFFSYNPPLLYFIFSALSQLFNPFFQFYLSFVTTNHFHSSLSNGSTTKTTFSTAFEISGTKSYPYEMLHLHTHYNIIVSFYLF